MDAKSGIVYELRDTLGRLRGYVLKLNYSEFKFDEKGLKYFTEVFDDGFCFDSEGYLAKREGDRIVYFHREFKFVSNPEISKVYVVHHKNHKKKDNRNCNLMFMTEDEHKRHHEEIAQVKLEKAQAKYQERGERMQRKYEERRERIQERYRKRGERMRERYEKRGERMRARFNRW